MRIYIYIDRIGGTKIVVNYLRLTLNGGERIRSATGLISIVIRGYPARCRTA